MARTGRVADDVAADWLTDLATRATHLTLMTADPFSVVDPLTVEVTSGTYARASVNWTQGVRLLRNANMLVWTGIPVSTSVAAIAAFDAAFNGNLVASSPITPALFYAVAGGLTIAVDDFFLGLDA